MKQFKINEKEKKIKLNILSLDTAYYEFFPAIYEYLIEINKLEINCYNIKNFLNFKRVDDKAYSHGKGMVIMADVIDKILKKIKDIGQVIYFSPAGKQLDDSNIYKIIQLGNRSNCQVFTLIVGKYEGIDVRVLRKYKAIEVAVSNITLFSGDIPAMAFIQGIIRYKFLKKEIIKDDTSISKEFYEVEQYSKPFDWQGNKVPEVLINGNHKEIFNYKNKLSNKRKNDLKKYDIIFS